MLWLQATVGNQAVSFVVQTDRATSAGGGSARSGPNAMFDALAADHPAIVGAMRFDELAEWRTWLGGWAHNKSVDEALDKHDRQYRKNMMYPDMPIADSRWLDRQAQIEARRKAIGDHAGRAKLDPQKILDDDVSAIPQWNVAPETRYRQWAVQHFASKPLVAELTDRQEIYSALQAQQDPGVMTRRPHLVLWWGNRSLENTKGKVTFADLLKIPEFADKYRADVWDGPEVRAVRDGIEALGKHIDTMLTRHIELSEKNRGAEYEGTTGAGVKKAIRGGVRHISEGLGAPSMFEIQAARIRAQAHPDDTDAQAELAFIEAKAGDYPKWDKGGIWDEPMHQRSMAKKFQEAGQIELAAGALLVAEQSSALATTRFAGYEARVMGGAGIAVKWLERAKTAGKIASAFTGASGIVQAAAVGAGYTFVQEGGQELAASALDPEHKADFRRVTKMAAIDGLASMFGGVTQGAFTKALSARFSTSLMTTWKLSAPTAEKVLNVMSATTSSFYNVPAKIVLEKIIDGKAFPRSLAEVSDIIVQEAATSTVMATAGEIIQSYAAKPEAAPSGEPMSAPRAEEASAPAKSGGGGEGKPKTTEERMTEMLQSGGKTGTAPAEAPGRLPPTSGRAGQAPEVSPATARLAAELHPIMQEWGRLGTVEKRAMRLVEAIEPSLAATGVPPIKDVIPADINGARFVFDSWKIRIEKGLFDKADISPAEFANVCGLIRHELEHAVDWFRMARQQHVAGESHKDLATRMNVPGEVARKAIAANEGKRPAEPMTPDLTRATNQKWESVYGQKALHRDEVLENVEAGWKAIEQAKKNLRRAETENLGLLMHDTAIRELADATAKNAEWEAKYHALPEEVPALRAGDELAQAVREHGIQGRLNRARVAEQEAYNRYLPVIQQAAALRPESGQNLSLEARRALNKAVAEWMSAVNHVKTIEREIAALRAPARP